MIRARRSSMNLAAAPASLFKTSLTTTTRIRRSCRAAENRRRRTMPVVTITGPSGLTKGAKRQLIEGTLRILAETIFLPDDRVYIHEVPVENVGHTPLLEVTHGEAWAVQSRSEERRVGKEGRSGWWGENEKKQAWTDMGEQESRD